MALPKTIKVGHLVYTVVEKAVVEGRAGKLGSTNEAKCEITMKAKLVPTLQRSVFMHEIFHAIHQTMAAGLEDVLEKYRNGKHPEDDDSVEEYFARLVEMGIIAVLDDNPAVRSYMEWS